VVVAKNRTPAVAYLRTSSAANVAEGKDSTQRQRLAIQRHAKTAGVEIVAEFADEAVSGADPVETRPGFAAMLAKIEGDGIGLVLVEDASRFARSVLAQELGVLIMAQRGVRVLTTSGEDLTSTDDPAKVMMRQVAGAFAEYEKARLVQKLRGARDRASAREGRRVEGRKGYGETRPELVREAKRLARRSPKTGAARSRSSWPSWAIAPPRAACSRPPRSSGCSRADRRTVPAGAPAAQAVAAARQDAPGYPQRRS
jgi:DNA invertase Pin-like site-specific DNA recombinase